MGRVQVGKGGGMTVQSMEEMGKDIYPNFAQPFLENIDRRSCNNGSREQPPPKMPTLSFDGGSQSPTHPQKIQSAKLSSRRWGGTTPGLLVSPRLNQFPDGQTACALTCWNRKVSQCTWIARNKSNNQPIERPPSVGSYFSIQCESLSIVPLGFGVSVLCSTDLPLVDGQRTALVLVKLWIEIPFLLRSFTLERKGSFCSLLIGFKWRHFSWRTWWFS